MFCTPRQAKCAPQPRTCDFGCAFCKFHEYRAHLTTAAEMLSKIRTVQEEMGEEFVFEDQVWVAFAVSEVELFGTCVSYCFSGLTRSRFAWFC